MSSILFPDSSGHEDQYYQPSFDTSSFQMNPHSSHPPRTPKTSIHANSSQKFSSNNIYEDAPSVTEEKVPVDDEDIEIEDEKAKDVGSTLRREEIWREIIVTSNGRDKVFVSLA
jgi:hypothetical protein